MDGAFLPENGRAESQAMDPLASLVYYAAVAKGTVILADYADAHAELRPVAEKCLEFVPPLHSRFSYTTGKRMFIGLIEGLFIYCAIMDEALNKAKAFLFLEQVRDVFKGLLKEQGADPESLGPHSLDEEMAPIMRLLAVPLVGLPQKEKDHLEEELQAQPEAEVDPEVSSPSAVVPLDDMSDRDFAMKPEQKPLGSRSPRMPLIGKGKKDKTKIKEQENEVKEIIMENQGKAMDKGKKLDIMVGRGTPADATCRVQMGGSMKNEGKQLAQKRWWRNVRLVLMLDVLACLVFLAIWLGVCQGVTCLKQK